ncbi:circadian clock KaiB family protein [Phenylobacterium terrae]|uniref:circadian clock KaiB family protein n=1 Tax=Phenylobacterium terrae TaxID=2665495 RepID=UPI00366EA6FD
MAGDSAGARRARENLQRLRTHLPAGSAVEVVDVLVEPGLAEAAGILATPTLSDDGHDPPRRIVGDLSDLDRVMDFFGLAPREAGE